MTMHSKFKKGRASYMFASHVSNGEAVIRGTSDTSIRFFSMYSNTKKKKVMSVVDIKEDYGWRLVGNMVKR